jgi:hypothetical protein
MNAPQKAKRLFLPKWAQSMFGGHRAEFSNIATKT